MELPYNSRTELSATLRRRIHQAMSALSSRRLLFPIALVVAGSILWFVATALYLHQIHHQLLSALLWLLFVLMILVPRAQASPITEPKDWLEADNKARQTIIQVIGGLVILAGAYSAWRQFESQQRQFDEQRRQFQAQLEAQQRQTEQQRQHFQIQVDNQRWEKDDEGKQFQLQLRSQQQQLEEQRKQFQLQYEATREEQIAQRFGRAIEQLASSSLSVRLGGIFALERVARDSPERHWTVLEVLTAFVRERAPWDPKRAAEAAKPLPDVQASLMVLARNSWPNLDLPPKPRPGSEEAKLTYIPFRARLAQTDLRRADLIDSVSFLQRADLTGAHLEGADLRGALLDEAILIDAFLDNARLDGAKLRRAYLGGASLVGAVLENADFSGAKMERAILRCAFADGAKFTGADLGHVSFEGAETSKRTDFSKARMSLALFCSPGASGYQQYEDEPVPRIAARTTVAGQIQGASLFGADLRGCTIGFEGWHDARFHAANVHGVTNAPPGFVAHVLANGGVALPTYQGGWGRMLGGSGAHPPFARVGCSGSGPPEWYGDTPR